jgi:hypothetical protein
MGNPSHQFTSLLEQSYSDVWYCHFVVPDDVAREYIETDQRRVICTLNDEQTLHAGLMPLGDGRWFINVNKEARKKLGVDFGDEVHVALQPDTSEFGMEVSEEFREVLLQDPDAEKFFRALTPGKQRNLIYFVGNVKSSQIKIRRAFVVTEHLKNQQGKIDFKLLNAELKEANRRAKL